MPQTFCGICPGSPGGDTNGVNTMSQKKIEAALQLVVKSAREYASAGAALTQAALDALLVGATSEEIIRAVRCGFEEAGETMPAAWPSNIRRMEAAGTKHIKAVQATGLALNNKVLDALNVPTRDTGKGRPKGKPEAKAEPVKTPTDLRGDTLEGAKHMLRALLAGKAKVCGTQILDKYENCLTECLALLSAN